MTVSEETTNVVLEHLRHIRGRVDSIDERIGRLELRFGVFEGQVAHVHVIEAGQNLEIDRIRARLDRVERRLELTE